MLLPEAYRIIGNILAPYPVHTFLEETVGKRPLKLAGGPTHARTGLLGPDAEGALLSAYHTLAPQLTSHAASPAGLPPASESVASPERFREKIADFHSRGYTVRIPAIRSVTPQLELLVRALEVVLHQPVDVVAFWSQAVLQAPVHYDNDDLIAIQLVGRKRWFVSNTGSVLPNRWKPIPDGPAELGAHDVIEMSPGDLLYLPRGTTHSVETLSDSVHVTIGFTPLTLREALLAMVDELSDNEQALRETVHPHLAIAVRRNDFGDLPNRIRYTLSYLLKAAQSDNFVSQALQKRSSRAIEGLSKIAPSPSAVELLSETRLRQTALSATHLTGNGKKLDISYPGGHLYVHSGAEEAVMFILNQADFKISDIPGDLPLDVRVALVEEFINRGLLDAVPQ